MLIVNVFGFTKLDRYLRLIIEAAEHVAMRDMIADIANLTDSFGELVKCRALLIRKLRAVQTFRDSAETFFERGLFL